MSSIYVCRFVSCANRRIYVMLLALIFLSLGPFSYLYFTKWLYKFEEKWAPNIIKQYSPTTHLHYHRTLTLKTLHEKFEKRNKKWLLRLNQANNQGKHKKSCPSISPLLVGWSNISLVASFAWKQDEAILNSLMAKEGLKIGGMYGPTDCRTRNKVAIVVPYRNRKNHLKIFLSYMHPFLQRQQLEYIIVIVEQSEGSPFNRGMLMNIGFKEAQLLETFQCFIFHDVDLLPEHDGNLYTCPEEGKPRQMAFSMDIFEYTPTPLAYFGGVNAFSTTDFERVNGFSNLFWGWGNEDDDLYQRVLYHNLTITRIFGDQPSTVPLTRYSMLNHRIADPNPDRMELFFQGTRRRVSDGLADLHYQRLGLKFKPLYTHILVDLQKK